MLFNEPKLLKSNYSERNDLRRAVSVLFNEPKLLKSRLCCAASARGSTVSVLFNEPKLLKSNPRSI